MILCRRLMAALLLGVLGISPGVCDAASSGPPGEPFAPGTPNDGGTPNSITVGGTAQNAFNANTNRHGCSIGNNSSDDMWVNELTTAAIGAGHYVPGGSEWYCPATGVPAGVISIIGPTTGQAIFKVQW